MKVQVAVPVVKHDRVSQIFGPHVGRVFVVFLLFFDLPSLKTDFGLPIGFISCTHRVWYLRFGWPSLQALRAETMVDGLPRACRLMRLRRCV